MLAWPLSNGACPDPAPQIICWFPEDLSEPLHASPLEPAPETPVDAADAWESDCVRQTQSGKPEAFNPLVARYAPRIRAYLFRIVRNREEAEDLTQETFIKAFRAIHRFEADRPFKRWLYTIATNTGLNALRAQKGKGALVALAAEQGPAGTNEAPRVPSAAEERLEAALARLSPRAAQLITLHYHEGFSLLEAGAVLGMTEGAARAALCRARQEIRRIMNHEL